MTLQYSIDCILVFVSRRCTYVLHICLNLSTDVWERDTHATRTHILGVVIFLLGFVQGAHSFHSFTLHHFQTFHCFAVGYGQPIHGRRGFAQKRHGGVSVVISLVWALPSSILLHVVSKECICTTHTRCQRETKLCILLYIHTPQQHQIYRLYGGMYVGGGNMLNALPKHLLRRAQGFHPPK